MKNFDLNAYGVSEMRLVEMQEVEGGCSNVLSYVFKAIGEFLIALGEKC